MFSFSTKRIGFYLLLTLILSSTLKADRMKSLDSYYNDVKKSAEDLGYSLENVKRYMDEIDKPNSFPKKTLLGVKPRWYTANRGYYTFTTVYPYEIKNTVFKKNIRGVVLKDKQSTYMVSEATGHIALNMFDLGFLVKKTYSYNEYKRKLRNSLKERIYPNSNINQVLLELEKYENKIRVLVENNIYMNIKKLSKNIHHTNRDFMKYARTETKTKQFNIYDKDDKIIENNQHQFKLKSLVQLFNDDFLPKYGKELKLVYANNYNEALEQMIYKMHNSRLKIKIIINNHGFNIVSHSKEELYDKESKFLSILDEYEKKGFCYKSHPKRKTYKTIYQSINDKGYIQYTRTPSNRGHISAEGTWATSIWGTKDDLRKVTKAVENDYENFLKLTKKYLQLALEKIIKKHTDNSEGYKGFGNEF